MKLPLFLRLPFSLLPLLALLTLLRFRSTIRHTFSSPAISSPAISTPAISSATLLRLASADPYSASVLPKHIASLLSGHLRPDLRRSLLHWWRHRSFQPEIISNLTDLIKTPIENHFQRPNPNPRYPSCAVVGNSGILLKNNHGALIDGHDLVIRLNNARINGFELHVGSKTNISFINSNILHLCASRKRCFCHPYGENVPIVMYICQAAHFLDYAVCNSSFKSPLLITDIRFDMLCFRIAKFYSIKRFVDLGGKSMADWAKFHDEMMFHYSSGMQAVMLAVGICDRVSVFGFGKSEAVTHHYHTN